jgi:undecaprenyl-diphosphatase
MIESLISLDENLFLFLNSKHNAILDQLMWLFSNKIFWLPLYLWFLWLLYKQYSKKYWSVLIVIVLMIIFSDQLCNLSKDGFMRLRPSQTPHLQSFIHLINDYRGGMYGFYSGHAANSFAVAMFMIISSRMRNRYIVSIAIIYALLTSYSRIYLGVHYPGDVITGIVIGSVTGYCFAKLHEYLRFRYLETSN